MRKREEEALTLEGSLWLHDEEGGKMLKMTREAGESFRSL